MDNLKYFPFYYARFSDGVRGYDMEFVGIYIMLLCRQAELNRIPDDLKKLSRWMGGINTAKIAQVLRDKFLRDDCGFYNEVLDEVLIEIASKSESARKSVNARWERIRTYNERIENVSKNGYELDTNKVKESKVNKKKEIDIALFPSFDDFWEMYDKKKDRRDCEKKWAKLTQSEKEAIMCYIPRYHQSQPDIKFRRYPTTFLNKRTWENEIEEKNNHQKLFKDESELADFLNVRPDGK